MLPLSFWYREVYSLSIAAGPVGGTILLLLPVLVVCCCCYCHRKKKNVSWTVHYNNNNIHDIISHFSLPQKHGVFFVSANFNADGQELRSLRNNHYVKWSVPFVLCMCTYTCIGMYTYIIHVALILLEDFTYTCLYYYYSDLFLTV